MNHSTKATPMTKDETMLVVELVAAKTIINNKVTNATNNRLKEQAWQCLSQEFNSTIISSPRIPAQLRLKWENLKKSARKRCAKMRSSVNKTGSSKHYFPPDKVLDTVTSLLGLPNSVVTVCKTQQVLTCKGSTGSQKTSATQMPNLEEEKCKALILRDNAMAEYLIAKTKNINLENELKEITLVKLRFENARLRNSIIKSDLSSN